MTDPFCHTGCILVNTPADAAFEIMADGLRQGEWASSRKTRIGDNLFVGLSALDGKESFVRIDADPQARIADYETGRAREELRFRNSARVIPGPSLGYRPDSSLVVLTAWRLKTAPEHAWQRTCVTHEAEMYRIKDILERDGGGKERLSPLPGEMCHTTSILVGNDAEAAFAFISDPATQGLWSWGESAARHIQPAKATCRSDYDGRTYSVQLRTDRTRMLVDCDVGVDDTRPSLRHAFRVLPAQLLDHDAGSVITLTTWRSASEDAFQWARACANQEAELLLIKERLSRR